MLVIVPGAGLALFNHPLTFLSSSLDCDSRWLLRAKSLVYLRSLVKPVYKGGESKCLKVALWDGVFLHPWTVSWRQVCPRGSRCHCEATSLSLWCPFSPLPTVTCYLKSPRHVCTSLEHGYNYQSEWTLGVCDGQGGLACCDSWGRKESDPTERLNWTELN